MARHEYQAALEELRTDVAALGDDVLAQLDRSLHALEHDETAAANGVIEGDAEINDRYLELEAACIDLIALQQPVASDLRFVVASFKILTDIERIGDLATNLAGYAIGTDGEAIADVTLFEIGAAAHDLVEDALAAYETGDADACHRIAERDDEIDSRCHRASERVVRDLIEQEAGAVDPWEVEAAIDDVSSVLLTIRDLERVADHGVNIAARTLYLTENDPALLY
ncbi:phosphate uptake regulator, PhoU [Halovivax asiaticus JCM 14624]|uniref:Phosphate-specific transport system accessory protein PhoU n=1 Tax=Halovivax asiaticus JCM 14624 TaxID=1227490 RepID=M0BNW8_9EURY|nr:phosphate signaling complex protein PhoU [Halovivax asiaticus]ELZ12182.1 phosphate uptake regulator, PhoU [Halovivax asiaticus JCM 14624]